MSQKALYNRADMGDGDEKVQLNFLVPKSLKERAQREADLAHEYGWIPTPTLTQLFTYAVDSYLFDGLKKEMENRRKSEPERRKP